MARKKAEAKSRFRENQEAVLRVYESGPIQALAAFLIVAVLSHGSANHAYMVMLQNTTVRSSFSR